jgi:4-aminobutyrate aminotransferase-like enzyme
VHLPFPLAGRADSAEREREALHGLHALESDGRAAQIGTVVIETLQGNSGQRATSRAFLHDVQAFARRNGAVFVLDETQSAFGRAGTWFAFEGFGLAPDLVVAGKGISSSLPLTIMLGRSEVFDAAPAKALSSTHGGNPMACRAACEVLDILEGDRLLDNSREIGAYLLSGIRDDARGTGLMIGVAILDGGGGSDPARAKALVEAAVARGLLVLAPIGLDKNVVRISPPLILTREQAAEGLAILAEAFAEVS